MLLELTIADLALIEGASLELAAGLNVLSGETGAGKSLFVSSLELLSGLAPRGGAAQRVRQGAKSARVEGRFFVRDARQCELVATLLDEELPELGESFRERAASGEAELILGRSITADGRTRAHVDQRPVPVRALRRLAPLLMEIHGQNEHQSLHEPEEQVRLLDAFGELGGEVASYAEARAHYRAVGARHARLEAERAQRRDRLDMLRFQHEELESLDPRPGEVAELGEERELLRHAESLRQNLGVLVDELYEADPAIADRLRHAEGVVARWTETLPRLAAVAAELESARLHVEEASGALASLLDGVDEDPSRLETVEGRLADLERLMHKYASDEDGLLRRRAETHAAIRAIEEDEESLATIEEELAQARATLTDAAAALGRARRAIAPELAREVEAVLATLGLGRARFDVGFTPREGEARYGPFGSDDVAFLLAANPGETTKPLRNVASGGETARIMLALRTVLSACDQGRTLVFDEIDSGVGGRLGPEVGAHLRTLAELHQVLCVTHLPAIAASAHVHFVARKSVAEGRTRTAIAALDEDGRVAEVADMIAGGAGEATARAEARRLLERRDVVRPQRAAGSRQPAAGASSGPSAESEPAKPARRKSKPAAPSAEKRAEPKRSKKQPVPSKKPRKSSS